MGNKNIGDIFELTDGNIVDKSKLQLLKIDTIVNAAKPTLMGSHQGVDGAIHEAIDRQLPANTSFKDKICEELKSKYGDHIIRCGRGKAVTTRGYGLCNYVIHVVGAEYDGRGKTSGCSSSRAQIVESCYFEIVKEIRKHPDMKCVAVPVISSGEYGFPFELAVKLAVASIGNALVEWKKEDPEMFDLSALEKMYLYIYRQNETCGDQNYRKAQRIFEKYRSAFEKNKRVVYQSSAEAHIRYINEIVRYDEQRGYFSVAKNARLFLMLIRFLFMPAMILKDKLYQNDWENRRRFVEKLTFGKALLPLIFYFIWKVCAVETDSIMAGILSIILIYNMCDTVTYLLVLILMSDIQRPSANIIRSMILLFVNYMEVSFEMAFLYYQKYKVLFREAVLFGILGQGMDIKSKSFTDYLFVYAGEGLRFFFVSLVFGYFAAHMKQRRFRD